LLHQLHRRLARDRVTSVTPRNEQHRGVIANAKSDAVVIASSDYSNTLTRMLWDAVIKTVTIAVQHVPLPPEKFDEALDLLESSLGNKAVRSALVAQNADAVWLVDIRAGRLGSQESQPLTNAYTGRWAAIPA
jgi:hypothetical protein